MAGCVHSWSCRGRPRPSDSSRQEGRGQHLGTSRPELLHGRASEGPALRREIPSSTQDWTQPVGPTGGCSKSRWRACQPRRPDSECQWPGVSARLPCVPVLPSGKTISLPLAAPHWHSARIEVVSAAAARSARAGVLLSPGRPQAASSTVVWLSLAVPKPQ